jgi:putative transcriptional regulator
MDFLNIHKQTKTKELAAGQLLIAEPFLSDPNFARAVIFLCEYGEEGSIGFILNRPTQLTLGDLLPEFYTPDLSVNQGGPVQLDTLHMIHRMPDTFGGNEIVKGVYWGGSYDALQDIVSQNEYADSDIKLFIGYAGWSPGQLEKEIEDGSWLIADVSSKILFQTDPKVVWQTAINSLGKEYSPLANMPLNPQFN